MPVQNLEGMRSFDSNAYSCLLDYCLIVKNTKHFFQKPLSSLIKNLKETLNPRHKLQAL